MGVDYEGVGGIGIEVSYDEEKYEDHDDYFDSLNMKDSGFSWTSAGDGAYGGEYRFYITIDNPFKDGYDLTEKVKELQAFLIENNVDYGEDFEVDTIEDLSIW
jgi:hypothetical protein